MVKRAYTSLNLRWIGLLMLALSGSQLHAQSLSLNNTLGTFETCRNTPSPSQTFDLYGSWLYPNEAVTVTVTAGFEITLDGAAWGGFTSYTMYADGNGDFTETFAVRLTGNDGIGSFTGTLNYLSNSSGSVAEGLSGVVHDPTIAYNDLFGPFLPQGLTTNLLLANSYSTTPVSWVSSDNSIISMNSSDMTGVAIGTANITYTDDYSCSDVVTIEVIPRFTTNGYWDNSSNWSHGQVPGNNDNVYINANCIMDNETVTLDNLLIDNNNGLIIQNGSVLTVVDTARYRGANFYIHDSYFHQSDANSGLIGGSLGASNSNINVRYTHTKPDHSRFTYWSCPFSNEAINYTFLAHNLADAYYWDYTQTDGGVYNGQWASLSTRTSPFNYGVLAGEGFIMTPEQQVQGSTADVTEQINFNQQNATINNGLIPLFTPASGDDWVLIGNPYTSPLDLVAFLGDVHNDHLTGSAYFWDDNSESYSGNYAAYVYSGTSTAAYFGGQIPNGSVEPGQGFFVQYVANPGSNNAISFKNTHRTLNLPADFYKQEQRERVWVSLSNGSDGYQQIAVSLDDSTTTAFDRGFDAHFLDGHAPLSLYSTAGTEKLVIQSLPRSAAQTALLPLGVQVASAGAYTFSLDSLDHWPASREVVLVDSMLGTAVDLRSSDYTFSVAWAGPQDGRFFLRLQDAAFSADSPDTPDAFSWVREGAWIRLMGTTAIQGLAVFDVQGRKMMSTTIGEGEQAQFNVQNWATGTYTVQIRDAGGSWTSLQVVVGSD
jgi:hypothetical protein